MEGLEDRRLLAIDLSGIPDWLARGPSPSISGQVEEIDSTGPGADPVIGAIHVLALHPDDSDIAYLGGANGGLWRSPDFTDPNPSYEPLTDQFRSLSMGALEFDPTDATNNTLVAGIGRYSSFLGNGGDLTGLLKTTDGGDTWTELGNTSVDGLQGVNVSGVGPRGNTILVSSNSGAGGGVYRSLDGGSTFQLLSGLNGLPAGRAFDLVGDPSDNALFYVSIAGTGIYRTPDLGDNWFNASSDAALTAAFTAAGNNNAEMAVSPQSGRIFTGVLQNGRSIYIGYSDDQGDTWTEMDLPVYLLGAQDIVNATNATPIVVTTAANNAYRTGDLVRISGVQGNTAANGEFTVTNLTSTTFSLNGSSGNGAYVASANDFARELARLNPSETPGGQGGTHFSIFVDPNNDDIVYVGGDRQDTPFPNPVGATDFSGNLFRGDASVDAVNAGALNNEFSPQWAHLTHTQDAGFFGGGTADDSAPHADSREIRFRADGRLIEVDDGGIYARTSPGDNTGFWFSKMSDPAGGLQVTEMHDIAYDNNSDIIISGNQDTGTTEEIASGGLVFRSVSTADGGDVAVDNLIGGGESLRYSSTQNLGGFRRRVMGAANNELGDTAVLLASGSDPAPQGMFVTPLAVNEGAPNRLIIGAQNGIYESTDRGDTVARIDTNIINGTQGSLGLNDGAPIAYGTVGNPEALYVGTGSVVRVRTAAGDPLVAAAATGGGTVRDIEMDPDDFNHAFVIDATQVFETVNAGASWTPITGNLFDPDLRNIEYVPLAGGGSALLIGGRYGVHRMLSTSPGVWTELGQDLPNAPVWDMDYDAVDDILVVGTLGRGAWTVENVTLVVDESPVLTICGDEDSINQDDVVRLVRNLANPLLLDVFLNSLTPVLTVPLAALQQINVFGVGGNDELIIDSSNGLLTVPTGIRYNGDGACFIEGAGHADDVGFDRGFDKLTLLQIAGDRQVSETVAIGPLPGSGISTVAGPSGTQIVFFEELEPIVSAVPVTSFDVTADPSLASLLQGDNHITYTSGAIVPGYGRIEVDGFEPIEFSNKTDLVINGRSGNDVFVLNNSALPAGLETIAVNAGDGQDTIWLIHVPDAAATSFVSVTASGGDGDDVLDASQITVDTPLILNGDGGEDLLIGGRGSDQLNGGDDDDTLVGGDATKGSALVGNNTYRGGTGFDTIVILGTKANDQVDVTQSSAIALNSVVNGNTASESLPNADVEQVRVEPSEGDDVIRITIGDALFGAGADPDDDVLRFHVVGGGPNAGDLLNVVDDGVGDTVIQYLGNDSRSGSISIAPGHPWGAAPPIVYEGIEQVFVTPIDALTGETGTDGLGRLVVFKHDPWESNNTLPTATFLGAGATLNVDPTIAPGAGPLGIPGDQDFFQFVAAQTGVLDYQVYFEAVGSLPNGRTGLPGDGNLTIEVRDSDGTLIGSGSNLLDPAGNVVGRRFSHAAVRNQTYYLRVQGATEEAVNVYNFTVLNVPAPVPDIVDLQAVSDSGRSDTDDVTRVTTPTFDIVLDDDRLDEFTNLNLLPDTTDNDTADAAAHYGVEMFNNGVPIGYAYYTGGGNTWRFTATAGDLLEGHNNFLSAAVWVHDRADPEQRGRGQWGPALQVTLDTIAPPVSILSIDPAGLDSGVAGDSGTFVDGVTNGTATGFVGRAEANAVVRLYVDAVSNDPSAYSLTVALPYDGDEVFPNGQWATAFIRDLNDPALWPVPDGLREVLVTAEDLAGNVNGIGDGDGDVGQTLDIFIDTQGPVVTRVDVNSPNNPYELFDPKPSTSGPTPLVNSLVISVRDLPLRSNADPDFLYEALLKAVAENAGNYLLVGDHNGTIAIDRVTFTTSPALADGQAAEGYITIHFVEPLPDDRFTLTLSDNLVDPAGNTLDGESNTAEPQETPDIQLPSGDGQPGGSFVARFTVDSRAEVAVWSAGSVHVDSNGNYVWDPEGKDGDNVNEDVTYVLGFTSDNIFAGNFAALDDDLDTPEDERLADRFHKLAAYGKLGTNFRWLIDTNNDGVPDLVVTNPLALNGLPAAGNFDGDADNGDEVALKVGTAWYLDTNRSFTVDATELLPGNNMVGYPVVGDFDGDRIDDLGAWTDDVFSLDLSTILDPDTNEPLSGKTERQFRFGMTSAFIGVQERPIAADFDGDKIDDLGLWVPKHSAGTPLAMGEWYILVSGERSILDRIRDNPQDGLPIVDFVPEPFGQDQYKVFGSDYAMPVVGNFDPHNIQPPLGGVVYGLTNLDDPHDVSGDGLVSALDALVLVNEINLTGPRNLALGVLGGPFLDVNRDWQLTADDVLQVINRLNVDPQAVIGGEGEAGTAYVVPEASPPANLAPRGSARGVGSGEPSGSPSLVAERVDLVLTPARSATETALGKGRLAGALADTVWDDAAGFDFEDLLADLAFAEV